MSCCEDGSILEVPAGPHDRSNVIVSVPCEVGCECRGSHILVELDEAGNEIGKLAGQCNGGYASESTDVYSPDELVFIIPQMAAGETKRFRLTGDTADEAAVLLQEKGDAVEFLVNGELFTAWHSGPNVVRPYCYPVIGPGGVQMTREVFDNREKGDHIHHKSIYTAMGDVNGVDNWSEEEGHGYTRNREKYITSGPVYGQLWAVNDWTDKDGNPLLAETYRIRVYNTPAGGRMMDWLIIWSADYGGVFFNDTKEAGTLSIRLNPELNADDTGSGTIANAYGGIGEDECWGKRAPWVDYFGKIGKQDCGVAIFDHPDNYDFPTTWHVRGYGLFTVNQWGKHDFAGDWAVRGDLALPAGDALVFSFRMYFHEGDCAAANVAGKWLDFAFAPQAVVS